MKPEALIKKLQNKTKEQIIAWLTLNYRLKIAPRDKKVK